MTLITSKTAKVVGLVVSVLTIGTFPSLASAKCTIQPTRNPDAVKPCRQIEVADYTPPNHGHPSGTRGSGTRTKDPRDSQFKNHPQACDRFEVKNFQDLDKPLNPKENRWFQDFNCPVG